MKKIFVLLLVLGIMLFAVSAASAAGYDANLTLAGYEIGKSVAGLDVEVDNEYYSVSLGSIGSGDDMVQLEGWVFSKFPPESEADILLTGNFQANTDYYVHFVLKHDGENEDAVHNAIMAADFRLYGQKALYTDAYNINHNNIVELYFKLPVLQDTRAVPETGDGANIVLWCSMLAVSAIGILVLGRRIKREY